MSEQRADQGDGRERGEREPGRDRPASGAPERIVAADRSEDAEDEGRDGERERGTERRGPEPGQ